MSRGRICVLEDDSTIRELVALRLQREGLTVDSFNEAESLSGSMFDWDLYVLDILLSGELTGLDMVKKIRAVSPYAPILILSALSEPTDKVTGLSLGADDYLTKPFEMEELVLRVRGMLRRRSWYGQLPKNASQYEWADCGVDFLKFEGRARGQNFSLSQKECMLLKLLVEKEGEVVTRDEILDRVWGYNAFPSTRTVDNFILRLRKLFEGDTNAPRFFHSVRGVGYKFISKEAL